MKNNNIKLGMAIAIASALLGSSAQAGGLERGGYNIDLLFEPSSYALDAAGTYVNPQRKLNNVRDGIPTSILGGGDGNLTGRPNQGIPDSEPYFVPRIGAKAAFGSSVDCIIDYSQPWGAHTKPGANWAGANDNIETKIRSDNYAATCSYKFDAGPGQLRIIGGAFYQEVGGFKDRLAADLTPLGSTLSGIGHLELEGHGVGWRVGAAYEIPEYALRASLVYNSAVKLDNISGVLDLTQVPNAVAPGLGGLVNDVYGSADMPDSVELKLQSGIAPDWLAFGTVKWVDWSQLQSVQFFKPGRVASVTSLDLLYRDGWTVSGGIGHKFNDKISGAMSLTWDRGTSTGISTQTDTWTLGAGMTYAATENVEVRLAGAVGLLTSGSSGAVVRDGVTYGQRVSYDFDDDIVTAISTSLKVKF